MYLELYDFDNLKILECIYAYQMHKITGANIETCFKLKNLREADDDDNDLLESFIENEDDASLNIYNSNWRLYCIQTFDLRFVPPSTKVLIERYYKMIGHNPSINDLHFMGGYIRNNRFNINKTYEVANTWQVMHLSKVFQNRNIDKNINNIMMFFSKIYIRQPHNYEVDMIKNISIDMSAEEVRNEIIKFIEVANENDFRARRGFGARQ
jgi:hypothetical protein